MAFEERGFDSGGPRLSRKALGSLLLGLASFACLCFSSIPGLVLGIWGLAEISARPAQLKGTGLAIAGIVLSGLSFVWMPIAGVLGIALLAGSRSASEDASRAKCQSHLKQIALALHNYHVAHGSLPPPVVHDDQGRPMHSWRALLLPFLDEDLAEQYDLNEPWNGPHNSDLADRMPPVFGCSRHEGPPGDTDFVLIVGPGALFENAASAPRLDEVADGTSRTILLVETADSGIHWLEPRDLELPSMPREIDVPGSIRSPHRGGANIALADTSVHLLDHDTSGKAIDALVTSHGGEPIEFLPLGKRIAVLVGKQDADADAQHDTED